jgi:hypothetical protein
MTATGCWCARPAPTCACTPNAAPTSRIAVRTAYDQIGMPSFALIQSREYDRYVSLIAFDLLEKDGEDLRPLPLVAANGGCSTW